jgi:thiol-disulfide isomerase/thioredoxin
MTSGKIITYWILGFLAFMIACGTSLNSNPAKPDSNKTYPKTSDNSRLDKLKLSELSGEPLNLKNYSGKPIFLNFWATWCAPCRSEMATIEEISKQFKNDVIFLLASDEDTSKIQSFLSEYKFDLHFIHMDVPLIDAYIIELPTTFLINARGELVDEEEGFRIWTQPVYMNRLKNLIDNRANR